MLHDAFWVYVVLLFYCLIQCESNLLNSLPKSIIVERIVILFFVVVFLSHIFSSGKTPLSLLKSFHPVTLKH